MADWTRDSLLKSIFGCRRHPLVRICLLMRWVATLAFMLKSCQTEDLHLVVAGGGGDNGKIGKAMSAYS